MNLTNNKKKINNKQKIFIKVIFATQKYIKYNFEANDEMKNLNEIKNENEEGKIITIDEI